MERVFCRAAWQGVDYIGNGTTILWILGWSDRTKTTAEGLDGDVHYRLWDFSANTRADADQRTLIERGYCALIASDGGPEYERARRIHEAFGKELHAAITAAASP